MDVENDLLAVERIFVDYPNLLQELAGEQKNIENEIDDIIHAFEFGRLNAVKRSMLSNDLIRLRKRRREIKNQIEIFEELKRFTRYNIKKNEIRNTLGKVRTIKNNQSKRTYTMRIRGDLQELVD